MEFGFSTLAQSAYAYAATTSIELMLFGGIFLLVLVYGLTYGKYRLSTLLIAAYVGMALFLLFPYLDSIPWDPGLLFKKITILPTAVFAIFVAFSYFILVPVIDCEFSRRKLKQWFEAGVLSLSITIVFTAIVYHIGISENVATPESLLDSLFLPVQYLFWWFLVPLMGLYITRD